MVVKNLAIAVFGLEVLQMSSVTGIKCNKYKDRKPKPKLNETKILAIQGMNFKNIETCIFQCLKLFISPLSIILKIKMYRMFDNRWEKI